MAVSPVRERIRDIRTVPASSVRPNPLNARVHTTAQRNVMADALDEIGNVDVLKVVAIPGTDDFLLVDGHLRQELRADEDVMVAVLDLDESEQAKVLATFDPIGALAGTDRDKLKALAGLADIQSASLARLMIQMSSRAAPTGDEIESDGEAPTRTETGQVWRLGTHHLLVGDCTHDDSMARLLDGVRPDVMLTDPPYGIGLIPDWSGAVSAFRGTESKGLFSHTAGGVYRPVIGDEKPFDPAPILERFSDAREAFLFGADYYSARIPGLVQGSWLVWDKRTETNGDGIGSEFEMIWSRAPHKRRVLRHDWFGFLSSSNHNEASKRLHPTQKPTSLLRDILAQWGKDGDVVVDPYAGSGSTLIACEQLRDPCYAVEIDPRYADVTIKRWETFTGRTAELLEEARGYA